MTDPRILNYQSLRKHSTDLQDSICRNSNFLLLTETWCSADESVDLPNFHCMAKFKRQNVRAAVLLPFTKTTILHILLHSTWIYHFKMLQKFMSPIHVLAICVLHMLS